MSSPICSPDPVSPEVTKLLFEDGTPRPSLFEIIEQLCHPGSFFIHGEYVRPRDPSTSFSTVNPSSKTPICTLTQATAQEVDRAVQAAHKARKTLSIGSAAPFLRALGDQIKAHLSNLALIESLECVKPFQESLADLNDCVDCCRFYALECEKLASQHEESRPIFGEFWQKDFSSAVRLEPVGPVAAITPFNYPILIALWKICPALAAGCPVVIKPSEETCLTTLALGTLSQLAGFPPGWLNIVTGGALTGQALVGHSLIKKVSFTGSLNTGKNVMQRAAEQVKSLSLELGGKAPMIVLEDCEDLGDAAEWVRFCIVFFCLLCFSRRLLDVFGPTGKFARQQAV
jgi:betaine-aldehyde dehydrogenase